MARPGLEPGTPRFSDAPEEAGRPQKPLQSRVQHRSSRCAGCTALCGYFRPVWAATPASWPERHPRSVEARRGTIRRGAEPLSAREQAGGRRFDPGWLHVREARSRRGSAPSAALASRRCLPRLCSLWASESASTVDGSVRNGRRPRGDRAPTLLALHAVRLGTPERWFAWTLIARRRARVTP